MRSKYWFSSQKTVKTLFHLSIPIIIVCVSLAFAREKWTSFANGSTKAPLSYQDLQIGKNGAYSQCKVAVNIPGATLSFPSDNGLLAGKYAALSFIAANIKVLGYNVNGSLSPGYLGKPDLPFVRVQVRIPLSVNNVKVEVLNTEFMAVEGKYTIAPIQKQLFESFIPGVHADSRVFQQDMQIYNKNKFFTYDVEYEMGICHHMKILEIRYSPLQYNPVTQELLATGSAQIAVTYLDGNINETPIPNIFERSINRKTFDGLTGKIKHVYNSKLPRGGKFVVVSSPTLMNTPTFTEWINYRTAQGYEHVKTIDASSNSSSAITSEIESLYSSGLDFVVVVGDETVVDIPTGGTDYHYKDWSRLEGSDELEDVGLGVFLCDDETKLQNILTHQQLQEAGGDWGRTVVMTAGMEGSGDIFDRFSSSHYATIKQKLDDPNGGQGYTVNRVYKVGSPFPTQYGGGYGVPRTDFEDWVVALDPFFSESSTATDKVVEYWNMGAVIIGHRDHGSPSGPSSPPITYRLFSGDIQGDCSPLFTSLNCSSGDFEGRHESNFAYQSQCNTYGTCASLAATVTTYSGDNDYFHIGLYEAMFPIDGANPADLVGTIFMEGHLSGQSHSRTYFHMYGDPMTKISMGDNTPTILVRFPNGGEEIEQGTVQEILWYDNIDGNVKIELLKGGSVASELAASTESDGAFEWQVPGDLALGSDYKMKVTSIDSTALFDESNDTFSIVGEYIIVCPYFQPFDTLESDKTVLPKKWEQLTTDDFDWIVLSGPTPSKTGSSPDRTGPDGDHTTGNDNYIYMEASDPNNPDKKADFVTPKFDFKHLGDPKLTFWYHMFSADNTMGILYLDINVDGTWHNDVVTLTGDNGDEWFVQEVDLNQYKGDRVIFQFRGITGSSWCSDICIDDFKIDGAVPIENNITKTLPGSFDVKFFGSRIHYQVPDIGKASHVSIKLYNLQGKLVKTLVNRNLSADYYSMPVGQLATGMYLCRMEAKGFVKTINVLLTK